MIPSYREWKEALEMRQGREDTARFAEATVAICGLGGLGSMIAVLLARAGVGRLLLIDFDRVELTNLHRQQYKASQCGRFKTEALCENIREIAPYTELIPRTVRITPSNVLTLLRESQIVCEALDNPNAKAMLAERVLVELPDVYLVASSGMAGMGEADAIHTRRLSDRFWLCGDGESDVAEEGSLVASRVAVCAAHQAHAVLRILTRRFETEGKKEET